MKSKPHPNYIDEVHEDLSSPWALIFLIGALVGLYLYFQKGYSWTIPACFTFLLVVTLARRSTTIKGTFCPTCKDKLAVNAPYKAGELFTAECRRCNISWDLGVKRRPWINHDSDHWDDHFDDH